MLLSNKVYSIIPYLFITIIILYLVKPNIAFTPDGRLRNFGYGLDENNYKKTLFTMQMIIFFLSIIFYITV